MENRSDRPERAIVAAQLGESLRLSGNYSGSITCFDEAIEIMHRAGRDYWWAHAHRGAARMMLGNFEGATADFDHAKKQYAAAHPERPEYIWVLPQMGELRRLEARKALSQPRGYLEAMRLLEESIDLFREANVKHPANPWVQAHLGAAHTTRYFINLFQTNRRPSSEDFEHGDRSFRLACVANPSYGWAFAFHAILLALHGEMSGAVDLIGKAQMTGLDRVQTLQKVLMELSMYSARDNEQYRRTVQLAWQVLQSNSEEAMGRYFVADGLTQMKHPEAECAIETARRELHVARDRITCMMAGLDLLQHKDDDAKQKLREIAACVDMHTLVMLSKDPAWERARNEGWFEFNKIIHLDE